MDESHDKIEGGYFAYLVFRQIENIQNKFNNGELSVWGINLLGSILEVIGGDEFEKEWNALVQQRENDEIGPEDLYLKCVNKALHVLKDNKILYKATPYIKGKKLDGS